MGGTTFMTRSKGKTAAIAFSKAVKEAQYESGHGGYTGTIAEKHDFVSILCPKGVAPEVHADNLIDKADPRIDDKWGPAGCIEVKKGEYLFFGWASC